MRILRMMFPAAVALLSAICPADAFAQRITAEEVAGKSKDEFIDGLLGRMTVEEKIGQLNLPSYGNVKPDAKKSEIAGRISRGEVGGIFNIFGVDDIRALQEVAVEESRLGIPIIIGADICQGYKTTFPVPLALSCSWKPENIEEVARISAREVSADGVCWTYSPMVDISRDARWGRVKEGAGEDPYLGSLMAAAWVRGYQSDNLSADTTIMACVKHFALYGAAEAGRDYNPADMSRVTAMNYYMQPYKAAVDAGVGSVMSSFNEFESIPATGNSWLLHDILRGHWGFKGFVVSDYLSISEMMNHGVGYSEDVTLQAFKAGVDMDMIADLYHANLKGLIDEGKISMAELDDACRRMLVAKYDLGLFHNPYRYCNPERGKKEMRSAANLAAARRIAAESYVLLKNDGGILPLSGVRKVAVVGPLADSRANMSGSWTKDEATGRYNGLVENLRDALGGDVEVVYSRGSNLVDSEKYEYNFTNRETNKRGDDKVLLADALKTVEGADVIIAAMGESLDMSGEGDSRAILEMPECQERLMDALDATGIPVVMVLFTGRPLAMERQDRQADAILNVWEGGSEAGLAIADVLTGKVNPTAKLTMTFPRVTGQCPIYYNHKNTGRPVAPGEWYRPFASNYIDVPNEPLYPFGYGLSYTDYEYGYVTLSSVEMSSTGRITVSVAVTNTGSRDGEEIVQLYLRDMVRSITPPVKELKDYRRVALKAGETKTVTFEITVDDLKFYNSSLDYVAEPGEFTVMIGGNSRDVKTAKFMLK